MSDTTPSTETTPAPAGDQRGRPDLGVPTGWWPIAHSEEIVRHPRACRLGVRDLAVYRDLQGVVRAVDDSCPHRRLPLSMGRITEDGYLQCRYHGWCFDGATGRCTAIPNLHEHEKIPGGIRVAAFTTAENVADALGFGLRTPILAPAVGPPTGEEPPEGTVMFDTIVADGLVLVWTGDGEPEGASLPGSRGPVGAPAFAGTVEVRAPHARVVEALVLNPGRALGLGLLLGSGEELCEPWARRQGETVTVQRQRVASGLPRASTFESFGRRIVTCTTTTVASTGLTHVRVDPDGRQPGARVTAAATPGGAYRTVVRWRGEIDGPRGARPALLRGLHLGRRVAGRAAEPAESIADGAERIVDDGIRALRAARAVHHRQSTNGGPS